MCRFGGGIKGLAVVCAIGGGLGGTLAPTAGAVEPTDPYNPDTVYVIHLTLPKTSEEKLEADPEGEYQPGEFSIAPTGGTPGSEGSFSTPVKVEVRLKGSTSFESLAGKAAFKLKFKKTERPFGLKKMTLNNMVQDPSMVHETLSYEEFRAAGVPAPRTGFADVYVNGHDYGMHLDLETIDEQALERMFGTPFEPKTQHLYEGEDGTDVVPGDATKFEVDEGEEGSIADLEALIAAVGSTGTEPWSTRVGPYAELGEMTRMWAVEKYVGQWDGYSGQVGAEQPNNYYLYDNPQGVFQMIPWGTDETFESDQHIAFDGQAGILFDKCIEDPTCQRLYWHALGTALSSAKALDLPARAATLDTMLAPWQEEEQGDGRQPYSRAEAHGSAGGTETYASARPAEAEAWLAAHVPPPEEGLGGGSGSEMGSGGGGSETGSGSGDGAGSTGSGGTTTGNPTPSGAPPAPPASGTARILRLGVSGKVLRTRLAIESPGTVSQRATFDLGGTRRVACQTPSRHRAAGNKVLDCGLTAVALEVLAIRPLKLLVVTTVHADNGETSVLRHSVTLSQR